MNLNPIESVRLGIIIAVLVGTLVLIANTFMRDRFRGWWWLIAPAILLLAVALDAGFETNREQLRRITYLVINAAEIEDAETIISRLHKDLELDSGMGKPAVSKVLREYFSGPLIRGCSVVKFEILRHDDAAGVVEFKVISTIDPASIYAVIPAVTTRWRLDFARAEGGEYEITNMSLLDIGQFGEFDPFTQRPPRR